MNESVTHNQNQPERELILVLEMESKGTDLRSSMLRLGRVMMGHWFHELMFFVNKICSALAPEDPLGCLRQ